MSGSLNKVTLIGNLGSDPEIRSTQDNREIATLSIATTDSWKDKNTGERKKKTEWHRIVVFSEGLVRLSKSYLKKGSKIYIEGALQTRKWTDNAGAERYTTEIVLQGYNGTITMLDSRSSGDGSYSDGGGMSSESQVADSKPGNKSKDSKSSKDSNENSASAALEDLDDEIPF